MTPRLVGILASAALALGLLGLAVFGIQSCSRNANAKYELNASESKGKADEHAQAGRSQDAQAAVEAGRVAAAGATVAIRKRELAEIRNPVAVLPPAEALPLPLPAEPQPDLLAVVVKQDEVIQAQGVEIEALRAQVGALAHSRDEWKAAFGHERDRALSLELALEAQKTVSKASLWRGRIGGVAVGFGVGFIAGRLR